MPSHKSPPTLPPQCPSCGAIDTVKVETTLKGPSAVIMWKCVRCDHRWPAKGIHAA